MKVANKEPKAIKSPVRVTKTQYALWHAKPVMLGEINKEGNYWYTSDGMRFMSSRDALEYLIKIRNLVELELAVEQKYVEKLQTKKKQPVAAVTQPLPAPVSKKRTPTLAASSRKPTEEEHAFKKFLSNMGYVKVEKKDVTTDS